jgi:glyoxylase-like metal-dependent hydrolase (beta-lactamase superfamily II)
MATYEVFAIRYGHHERRAAENFILPLLADAHDGPMPLDYFVWVIRNAERTILVDTGFGERAARERGRTITIHPAEALRRFGVDPDKVEDVVITHLHYDHAGNLDSFPNARIHLQEAEIGYATGPCMCHPVLRFPFDVEDVVAMVRRLYAGRVVFHAGDATIAEDITLYHMPGHSKGVQSVGVMTKRGLVLLASDASHFYANIERAVPFPLVVDVEAQLKTLQRLVAIAGTLDRLVPGHDPIVTQIYPRVPHDGVEVWALHEKPKAR